jgi:hypothetical protein
MWEWISSYVWGRLPSIGFLRNELLYSHSCSLEAISLPELFTHKLRNQITWNLTIDISLNRNAWGYRPSTHELHLIAASRNSFFENMPFVHQELIPLPSYKSLLPPPPRGIQLFTTGLRDIGAFSLIFAKNNWTSLGRPFSWSLSCWINQSNMSKRTQ